MTDAKLTNVRKTFNDGQVVAVDDINLHIEEGELIVLVGPSGCGKSTTLRCIAGLETPDSGTIEFGGHDVTDLPPKDREISMVFQNYALYPSMTVYENMAFGLKMRGADRETIDEQVRWAANMMEIGDLLDRFPNQLSGGQQQRVALGRAIVRDPSLFLLDEPLSNLDAKLRSVMRTEIQELQRELGVATVFVTHDQEEAMTMGDRIAVMNAGRIEQVDTPEAIYHEPTSLFVADFIGSPGINFFEMSYDGTSLKNEYFDLPVPEPVADAIDTEEVIVGVRPTDIEIVEAGTGLYETEIQVTEPMGDTKILYFEIGPIQYSAVVPTTMPVDEDDTVDIDFNRPNIHIFRPDGPRILKWNHVVETPGESEASQLEEVAADGDGIDRRGGTVEE